jgi:enoyl reductase-like protein
MSIYNDPKDPKMSIRLKYNRRREYLRHSLEQFLIFAKERLDEEKYGKIYKKAEVENLLEGAQKLLDIFPAKKEYEFTQEDFANFELMLEEAGKETEKIMENIKNDDTDYVALLKELHEDIKKKDELKD